MKETFEEAKDLNYWKNNAEEDYLKVPISVLRYITELEKQQERSYSEEEVRTWLISRDTYLYNYYTTYKNLDIPLLTVDTFIKENHKYLMGRKQFKENGSVKYLGTFETEEEARDAYNTSQERSYSEEEVNEMFDTLKRNSIDNVATISNVDLFISSWKQEFKKK